MNETITKTIFLTILIFHLAFTQTITQNYVFGGNLVSYFFN
jgi:hypothetical protein